MYKVMYNSTVIRKQIYLEERQQAAIQSLAEARGVSEAAVIRDAIDRQSDPGSRTPMDPGAWKRAMDLMRSLDKTSDSRSRVKWTREDLYEERLAKYGRHSG